MHCIDGRHVHVIQRHTRLSWHRLTELRLVVCEGAGSVVEAGATFLHREHDSRYNGADVDEGAIPSLPGSALEVLHGGPRGPELSDIGNPDSGV
jgi:hypothetical protein